MPSAKCASGATVTWEEPTLDDAMKEQIQEVWEFWLSTFRDGKEVRPVLSDKRKRKITKAVKLYGVEVCKQAILGNLASDFHQGNNQRGKKYNDVELILRDEEHVERFANEYLEAQEEPF